MGQTDAAADRKGDSVGFLRDDVFTLAHDLKDSIPTISQEWVSDAPNHGASLWIAVEGLDDTAASTRRAVRERIIEWADERAADMHQERFTFDFHVFVDDEGTALPPLPDSAESV